MPKFFPCCDGCDEESGRHPGCQNSCSEYLHAKEKFDRSRNVRESNRVQTDDYDDEPVRSKKRRR